MTGESRAAVTSEYRANGFAGVVCPGAERCSAVEEPLARSSPGRVFGATVRRFVFHSVLFLFLFVFSPSSERL